MINNNMVEFFYCLVVIFEFFIVVSLVVKKIFLNKFRNYCFGLGLIGSSVFELLILGGRDFRFLIRFVFVFLIVKCYKGLFFFNIGV